MAAIPSKGYGRTLVPAVLLALMMLGNARADSIEVKGGASHFSMEFRDAEIKDVLRALG